MRPDRGDRGAVAVFVGLVLVVLVPVCAIGVDLGMQRVARRDMQALADVVALDLARELDGRSKLQLASELDTTSSTSAISQSLGRNETSFGNGATVSARWGAWTNGAFDATAEPPTAVEVTAVDSVDFAFASGSGSATRSAVAQAESNACFSVGSFVAGLTHEPDTLVALLNPILGDTDLRAVSYQGLAHSNVSLLGLISAPTIDVGTVDELVNADDITVADLFLATATALRHQGGEGDLASAELLEHLAGVAVVASHPIDVADILDLTTSGEGALDARLDVLDLVAGAATVANGTSFVGAPSLDLGLPNLVDTTTSLSITEAPHIACGAEGAQARSSQINLTADGHVGTSVPVGTGELELGGPLTLSAGVGEATGTLGAVTCDPTVVPVSVETALTTMNVNADLGLHGDDIGVGGSDWGVITVDLDLSQQVTSALQRTGPAEQVTWTVPPESLATIKSTGDGRHVLPHAALTTGLDLDVSDIKVGGVALDDFGLLGPVVKAVVRPIVEGLVGGLVGSGGLISSAVSGLISTTVNPLIDSLNSVVGDLASAVGLQLAGADVAVMDGVKCNAPVLRH